MGLTLGYKRSAVLLYAISTPSFVSIPLSFL